jgi:hypothetical protein
VLTDSEGRLRDAASKKILLEVAVMKAIQSRNATSIDSVLKHLQQLRSEGGPTAGLPSPTPAAAPAPAARSVEVPPAPTATASAFSALRETVVTEKPAPKPVAAPAPAPKTAPEAPKAASPPAPAAELSSAQLEELWLKVVEAVGRVSNFTRAYLLEAHPVSFEKKVLLIGFDPEYKDHLGLVDNSKNHALLQTKLSELGYHDAMVKFVVSEEPESRVRAVPAPVPQAAPAPVSNGAPSAPEPSKKQRAPEMLTKEDFKNDPLIKKALEIFKGQIVDVRA